MIFLRAILFIGLGALTDMDSRKEIIDRYTGP